MEAACIKMFLNCNRSPAEVTVSKTYSAFLTYLARLNEGNTMISSNDQPHMNHAPQSRHELTRRDLGTSTVALHVGSSSTPRDDSNISTPNQASNTSSLEAELVTGSSPFDRQGADENIPSQRMPTRPSHLATTARGFDGTRVASLIRESRGSSSIQTATSHIRSSMMASSQPVSLGNNTMGDQIDQPIPSSQPVSVNNLTFSPRNLRRHNRTSAFLGGLSN